jgi:uncharacterized protein DUF6689
VNVQKRWPRLPVIAVAGLLLLQSAAACAGGSVVVEIIDGRKAKADITLPNPNGGNYTAEFELEFERDGLENLTVECLGLTADVLDATEIGDIESRLPHGGVGGTQHVDPAFPVRITVEPPANCGLAFENNYDVSLDTDDLVFVAQSRYRLVKAPIGGDFVYVTGAVTAGSVRVRGRTGGFSEFVMIRDDNALYAIDCEGEYTTLETRLANAQMSPTARRSLEVDLARSRAAYNAGDFATAIALLAPFDQHCVEYGGQGLPNRWRSQRDLDNVEGDLVGHTDNLRFMMGRLNGSP